MYTVTCLIRTGHIVSHTYGNYPEDWRGNFNFYIEHESPRIGWSSVAIRYGREIIVCGTGQQKGWHD